MQKKTIVIILFIFLAVHLGFGQEIESTRDIMDTSSSVKKQNVVLSTILITKKDCQRVVDDLKFYANMGTLDEMAQSISDQPKQSVYSILLQWAIIYYKKFSLTDELFWDYLASDVLFYNYTLYYSVLTSKTTTILDPAFFDVNTFELLSFFLKKTSFENIVKIIELEVWKKTDWQKNSTYGETVTEKNLFVKGFLDSLKKNKPLIELEIQQNTSTQTSKEIDWEALSQLVNKDEEEEEEDDFSFNPDEEE